ncbi:helix-turn-helix domain-containing protein [Rossellomorea sp. H39__3]
MKDLMARLKVLKEKAGVLNKELAAELGIANSNISSYFSGKQQISFMNFLSVLDYLQIEREEKKAIYQAILLGPLKKKASRKYSNGHQIMD